MILYYSSAMIFYPVASFCHYTPYYPVKGTQVGIIREPLREVGIQIDHSHSTGFCGRILREGKDIDSVQDRATLLMNDTFAMRSTLPLNHAVLAV